MRVNPPLLMTAFACARSVMNPVLSSNFLKVRFSSFFLVLNP